MNQIKQMKQVGRYLIREKIGHGGMAVVYRAYDPKNKIDVALKVLHANLVNEHDILQRFIQEAQAAASLQHPNIITIHEFGSDNRNYYITMDYIPSGTLKTLLEERSVLFPSEAVSLLSTIASALHQAHQIPLIHRDIKPANILLDPYDNPILSDFGIARVRNSDLTKEGSILGTPNYMSPEQASGEVATQASDIYALGVMLFEAVVGRLPFEAEHERAVMYQHVYHLPPRPCSINPAIPSGLEEVILKALEKQPENRFSSAKHMAQAMQASLIERPIITGNQAAISSKIQASPSQEEQTEPAKRGLALLIVLLLFALGIGGAYFYRSLGNYSSSATGDREEVAAILPTAEPTHTQEPTHTTLLRQPTNTPRSTFNPPPTLDFDPELVGRTAGTLTPVPDVTPTEALSATEEVTEVQPTTVNPAPSAPTEAPAVESQVATQVVPPTEAPVATQIPQPTQPMGASEAPTQTPTQIPTTIPTQTPTTIPTQMPTLTPEFPTAAREPSTPTMIPPTVIPPTVVPPTVVPPTATPIPPTAIPPTAIPPTVTSIPATPVPPTPVPPTIPVFAGYTLAPQPISPSSGEQERSDIVTFEWRWDGPALQNTDQFVLMGFRDGETLLLARVNGSQRRTDINMKNLGNFETVWKWYIRIEDQNNVVWPNTRSREETFSISLSSDSEAPPEVPILPGEGE